MNEVGASPTSVSVVIRERDVFNDPAVFGLAPKKVECASLAFLHSALSAAALTEILYFPHASAICSPRDTAFADPHRPSAQSPVLLLFCALKNIKDLHPSLLLTLTPFFSSPQKRVVLSDYHLPSHYFLEHLVQNLFPELMAF